MHLLDILTMGECVGQGDEIAQVLHFFHIVFLVVKDSRFQFHGMPFHVNHARFLSKQDSGIHSGQCGFVLFLPIVGISFVQIICGQQPLVSILLQQRVRQFEALQGIVPLFQVQETLRLDIISLY